MSDALSLLKEGNLDAALSRAKGAVRDDPGDPEARARLFQMFCLNGEWDRAEAQLEALMTSSAVQSPIWKQFQMLMRLERQRREAHEAATAPAIVGDPQDWMAGFAKAFELHQSGDVAGGAALREVGARRTRRPRRACRRCRVRLADGRRRALRPDAGGVPADRGRLLLGAVRRPDLAAHREAEPDKPFRLGTRAFHLVGRPRAARLRADALCRLRGVGGPAARACPRHRLGRCRWGRIRRPRPARADERRRTIFRFSRSGKRVSSL